MAIGDPLRHPKPQPVPPNYCVFPLSKKKKKDLQVKSHFTKLLIYVCFTALKSHSINTNQHKFHIENFLMKLSVQRYKTFCNKTKAYRVSLWRTLDWRVNSREKKSNQFFFEFHKLIFGLKIQNNSDHQILLAIYWKKGKKKQRFQHEQKSHYCRTICTVCRD